MTSEQSKSTRKVGIDRRAIRKVRTARKQQHRAPTTQATPPLHVPSARQRFTRQKSLVRFLARKRSSIVQAPSSQTNDKSTSKPMTEPSSTSAPSHPNRLHQAPQKPQQAPTERHISSPGSGRTIGATQPWDPSPEKTSPESGDT